MIEGRRFRTGAALVFGAVFVASVLGVATRPAGLLALIWPANALLAGLLIRRPELARWWAWPTAALAYYLADLLTGDGHLANFWLTLGNVTSAGVAYLVLRRLPVADRRLGNPTSIVYVMVAGLFAGLVSAGVGCWAVSWIIGTTVPDAWVLLFGGELSNHIVILPVVLAFGRVSFRRGDARGRQVDGGSWGPDPDRISARALIVSVALLLVAETVAAVVGGPGAMTFVLPALLVAAITLGVFPTAVLALISTAWTMLAVGEGWVAYLPDPMDQEMTLSLQIGLALIALGPIAVAGAMQERNETMLRLWHGATRDELTGALTRSAFLAQAHAVLSRRDVVPRPVAVLMMDLDRFKDINDSYGHAVGDAVLARFGRITLRGIRDTDLFGRVGGEEFAVLLTGVSESSAHAVAERIRQDFAVERHPELDGVATVSVGLVHSIGRRAGLRQLLDEADRSLYLAKKSGRNQVHQGPQR